MRVTAVRNDVLVSARCKVTVADGFPCLYMPCFDHLVVEPGQADPGLHLEIVRVYAGG